MQNDDGFNWHDRFTIGVPAGARRLKVTNLRGPKYLEAADGDELELLRWDFRPLGWTGRLVRTDGDAFVVDRDLPALEGEHFLICDNTRRSDYIVMKGCEIHDTHLREIVQPNHVTIEDTRFVRTGNGMKMGSAHSREFWCEGRGSKDIVFRRCTFEHTNTAADWCSGGDAPEFETYVRFPRPRPYPPGNAVFTTALPPDFDCGFHGDILVDRCRFVDPIGTLFAGDPVSNLVFRDNEIEWTGTRKVRPVAGGFRFGAARDVFIIGNRYRVPASVGPLDLRIVGPVPGLVVHGNTRSSTPPSL